MTVAMATLAAFTVSVPPILMQPLMSKMMVRPQLGIDVSLSLREPMPLELRLTLDKYHRYDYPQRPTCGCVPIPTGGDWPRSLRVTSLGKIETNCGNNNQCESWAKAGRDIANKVGQHFAIQP